MKILDELNIDVKTPPLKQDTIQEATKKSQSSQKINSKRPLTRQEADQQRYTTAVRWIIEVRELD